MQKNASKICVCKKKVVPLRDFSCYAEAYVGCIW